MPMPRFVFRSLLIAAVCFSVLQVLPTAFAQSESATVFGRVTDPNGAVIMGAEIEVKNVETNVSVIRKTNSDGLYSVPSLHPGHYLISVRQQGFKTVTVTELVLHVQDNIARNFDMQVGSASESVTVSAEAATINTTDASVSTVIDRNFAENLPMNGRSFQTLIELTPGVVLTASNGLDNGQFSVNGQRASSNYWMVDGVSANIGVSSGATPGNGTGGALGSFSAQGGTNSLVSVDALQEFRIQTSTYAPEFGRTPGGQISILTRSGTNQFHGTLFDYLRNDVLDANDWFADSAGLPKPQERQNDFGGTFGGPIFKDRTFFFFSYEGLRLRLPQTVLSTVPDLGARQNASPALQPFLNAFPLPDPNRPDDIVNGIGEFDASFSNRSSLDAYSLRLDHRLSDKLALFGRYSYSPSKVIQRGFGGGALSTVSPARITTQTATVGTTWTTSVSMANELRFNYSSTNASTSVFLDDFGGAVPLNSLPLPAPFTSKNGFFGFSIQSLKQGNTAILSGKNAHNLQRQVNIVDNLSVQKGSHALKFGVDYRRLSPIYDPRLYGQQAIFSDMSSAESGSLSFSFIESRQRATLLFHNLGVFAQDTWRAAPRLTITYGLRWDVDFAPSDSSGPAFPAVTGFNLNDFSNLALAPAGTSPFATRYANLAPRIGAAYQLSQDPTWGTVIRGGFGVFYDLATQEVGTNILPFSYPFTAQNFNFGGNFDPATPPPPPPLTPAGLSASGTLAAFDPNLKLPYTLQWNAAVEQSLGKEQVISASYIGSAGRRLIQSVQVAQPNANIGNFAQLLVNTATSDYQALQVQFQRRLVRGLQAIASYTWAHSIDTASAGSIGNAANFSVPTFNANVNRGPSDFDIRNGLSVALTYQIPSHKTNAFVKSVLGDWSVENVVQARSAAPVDVSDFNFSQFGNIQADVRPDLVSGQPLYLVGSNCASVFQGLGELAPGASCPGGKGLNPAAFTNPPTTPAGCDPSVDFPCNPARQGNLGRNALRGFGAVQWDFAVHRDFPIRESVKLQFRAEMFNVLNHPNFGPPSGLFFGASVPSGFGLSSQMLGRSLNGGNSGSGALSSLYQIGGPRSLQFALKLFF